MAAKFGTFGLRGLVADLKPPLVADHFQAVLPTFPSGNGFWFSPSLRPPATTLKGTLE